MKRITLVFLARAGVWAMAQFVLAFFVHVTARAQLTTKGWVVPPTKAYLQAFAVSEIVLSVMVLGLVVLVGSLLYRMMSAGEFGAGCQRIRNELCWSLFEINPPSQSFA